MNIIEKKISDLKPYDKNAKTHPKKQVELLAKNIEKFGFTTPVLINENDELIAGHGRLLAMQLLKRETVPCVMIEGLTEAEIKALRLADNKIAEMGEWDMDLAIQELKELDDDLLGLTGFDADLLIEPDENDDVIPEDVPPVAKLGDLWQLGRHRLLCGDATKIEDVERLMDGKKADMVFTDPPYGINYQTIKAPEKHKVTGDEKMPELNLLWTFSKPECEKYICTDWRNYPGLVLQIQNNGEEPKAVIVWNKAGIEERPRLSHVFMKWGFTHEWIVFVGKQGGQRYMFADVLYAKREMPSVTHHATAKPISIIVKTFEASSNQEDIVLDLFGGSGSTLIACEKTNRICYMSELDPKYIDVIIARWENYTGLKAEKI